MMRPLARGGITRIEVLVLAVIFLVLGCLAVSGILSSRVSARRQQCANNLEQIARGLRTYAEMHGGLFPYGTVVNDRLPPERRWSWYLGAWGFVGDGQLELLVDLDKAWDAEGNRPVRARVPLDDPPSELEIVALRPTHCPANPVYDDRSLQDATSYVGVAGIGQDAPLLPGDDPKAGIWGYDRQTRVSQITDGDAFTILLAETGLDCGPWMAGGPPTVRGLDPDDPPYLGPGRQFGGLHPGGCQVAMADGSVRLISDGVDPQVLTAQVAMADAANIAKKVQAPPLQFGLDIDPKEAEVGQQVHATLTIQNNGANPLTVPDLSVVHGKATPEGILRSLERGTLRLDLERDGEPVTMLAGWREQRKPPEPSALSFRKLAPGGRLEAHFGLCNAWFPALFAIDRPGSHRVRAVLDTTGVEDKLAWKGRVETAWVAFKVSAVPTFRPKGKEESDEQYARARVDFYLRRIVQRKGEYFANVGQILNTKEGVPALIAAMGTRVRPIRQQAESILQAIHSPPGGEDKRFPDSQESWTQWWNTTGSKLGRDKLWHHFDSHFQ